MLGARGAFNSFFFNARLKAICSWRPGVGAGAGNQISRHEPHPWCAGGVCCAAIGQRSHAAEGTNRRKFFAQPTTCTARLKAICSWRPGIRAWAGHQIPRRELRPWCAGGVCCAAIAQVTRRRGHEQKEVLRPTNDMHLHAKRKRTQVRPCFPSRLQERTYNRVAGLPAAMQLLHAQTHIGECANRQ
jgi:hypothetical protein